VALLTPPPTHPSPLHPQSAARAIRHAMGGPYFSLHVRRSDKLKACNPQECRNRDALTQPPAIERALRLWFPPGSRLYIGSTERPAFFAPLNTSYRLFFAESFAHLLTDVSNNYMLYAVETLLFFGSAGTAETLGYASKWVEDACFPAARLRMRKDEPLPLRQQKWMRMMPGAAVAGQGGRDAPSGVAARSAWSSTPSGGGRGGAHARRRAGENPAAGGCSSVGPEGVGGAGMGGGGSGVHVACVDQTGIVANGVTYGAACIHNPPCGRRMALVPAPETCQRRTDW
jgi:hypothetical protein